MAPEQMTPEEAAALLMRERENLQHLENIRMRVSVELGRKQMQLNDLLDLKTHDVIELDKMAGEAFDVRVNDYLFAVGEIVVVADLMAIRLTQVLHPPHALEEPLREDSATATATIIAGDGSEDDVDSSVVRTMVHIPAGPFTMGGRDEDSPDNERPAHTVQLSAYFISRYPVTNMDYSEFVAATGHRAPIHWQRSFPLGSAEHPVVNVSWQDACTYADWRGARLPTEAEWEKAARGTDERPYPWGMRFTEGERCNANNQIGTTTPVDEYDDGRSFYGVWDMAGNVYEWCWDYYDAAYYSKRPTTDPQGPESGQERVIRGGSYQETRSALRTTHRVGASEVTTRDNIGFRLALDA